MWTRLQLKDKAKYVLKLNYWTIVLVSLLAMAIAGMPDSVTGDIESVVNIFSEDYSIFEDDTWDDSFDDEYYFDDEFTFEEDFYYDNDYYLGDDDYSDEWMEDETEGMLAIIMILFISIIIFGMIFVVSMVFALAFATFLGNPVSVGASRFFLKSLNEKTEFKVLFSCFNSSYMKVVKVMFFRSLYTLLWSMLFIIPGMVKMYEYRMIPYLLAENPDLTRKEVFEMSKQMMQGQKWRAFVLDLSFILWDLASVVSLGAVAVFYANPYKNLTNAALYEELSSIHGHPAQKKALPYEDFCANGYQYQ